MHTHENLLIVAPHPDDETLGCGGMLGIKSKAGHEVHIAVLTDGSMLFVGGFGMDTDPSPDEVSALRKRETERAVSFLGGNSEFIRYFDFPDGRLNDHIEAASDRLALVIDEVQPCEVYTPTIYEWHPDHVACNLVTKAALEKSKHQVKLIEYFLALKDDMPVSDVPGKLIDLDLGEFYELKKQAIGFFDLHHKIILPQQTEPLINDNFASYLARVEHFIIDSE